MTFRKPDSVRFTAGNTPNAATAFQIAASGDTGYLSLTEAFSAGLIEDGDTVPYAAVAVDGSGALEGDWEEGIGTFADATPDTLTRTTVIRSSNSDAAVDFSGATAVQISVARVEGIILDSWEPFLPDLTISSGTTYVVPTAESFVAGYDYRIDGLFREKSAGSSAYGYAFQLGHGATPTWLTASGTYGYNSLQYAGGSGSHYATQVYGHILWTGVDPTAHPVDVTLILRNMGTTDPTVYCWAVGRKSNDIAMSVTYLTSAAPANVTSIRLFSQSVTYNITDADFKFFRRRTDIGRNSIMGAWQ